MKTTFLLIAGLIVFLIAAAYVIARIGVRNAKLAAEYEQKYDRIKYLIYEVQVCQANYDWILKLLENLGQLPYKNRERTQLLTVEFFKKYQSIAKKQIEEDCNYK